jgi:uncharacterized phage protein gp47/JayE
MAFIRRSYDDILDNALRQLTNQTNITQLAPGAKARALMEIISRQLSEQYQIFDANLALTFLSTARDVTLDLLGEIVGLERLPPITAGTVLGSSNVVFYTEASNFGAINNSADITIPKGTRVWTTPSAIGADDAVIYYVAQETVLPASADEQSVPTEAGQQGDVFNVGQETLTNHEYNGYADALSGTLLVRNRAAITNGRDLESDADFRYRVSKQVTASERANETAIRLAALSVPGVADVETVAHVRGLGTYGAYIKSLDARVSDDLVSSVQQSIDLVQSYGNRGFSLKPREIGVEMELTLTFRETMTTRDRTDISRTVVGVVYDYINNLDIGEDFIVNEVVQRVMQVDDRIKNVGTANQPIDDLKIWKTSRTADNRVRYTLPGDYTSYFDEKVLIEYSIDNPVRVSTI